MKQREFWAFDWLRFLLALYLVFYHTLRGQYHTIAGTWIENLVELGNMATSVFFVLSGFLLTHVYVILRSGREINRRNFFVARFSSILPLHIATFLFALIPLFVTIYFRGGISVPIEPFGPAIRMLGHGETIFAALINLALLSAWNPYYLVINYPSWSLSAIVFYYALFPFAAQKMYKIKSPVRGMIILSTAFILPGAIADALDINNLFTQGLLHHNPIIRLPLFLSGILLCVIFSRNRVPEEEAKYMKRSAGIIVATFTCGTYLVSQEIRPHILQNGFYFPAALAAVWICACATPIENKRVLRWGERLGAASLPMFLLHVPLFQLFAKVEKFVAGLARSSTLDYTAAISSGHNIEQMIVLYPLYIGLLIAVCIFTQEWLVIPLRDKLKTHFVNSAKSSIGTTKADLKNRFEPNEGTFGASVNRN